MFNIDNLNGYIDQAAEAAVKIRRELHMWPEVGNQEINTARLIERELEKLEIPHERMLNTSVIGYQGSFYQNKERLVVAIRAEMDAISIDEDTNLEFASKKEGYMHGCGHDAHMAIALGVAMVLKNINKFINIDVKYIFQEDEEGDGSAAKLVEKGVMEDVDMILGFHVKPEINGGSMGIKYGMVHAASLMFDIKVTGKMSHGAEPHLGHDAILAAANIITAAQSIVSREVNPTSPAVITFGKIQGGAVRNILAGEVNVEGIIRGEDEWECSRLAESLKRYCQNIGAAQNTKADISVALGYPPLINDDSVVNKVCSAVRKYHKIAIKELEDYSMTVDDFACYLEEAPGAYVYIGCGYKGQENSGLHTSTFLLDEDCIRTGIAVLVATILGEVRLNLE